MLELATHNVFVEGPDCSGKTTLIKNVHDLTGYQWHLMDRSQISRRIFAKMYGRSLHDIDYNFKREVFNLNNIFTLLMPEWEVVEQRFEERGDEIHCRDSLRKVYDAFAEDIDFLVNLPNVYLFSGKDLVTPEVSRDKLVSLVSSRSDMSIEGISNMVCKLAAASPMNECTGMSLTLFPDSQFSGASREILNLQGEKEYYGKIFYSMLRKIRDEIAGKNEYSLAQNAFSRRFIHTNDSCISLVHAVFRDTVLDIHVVARSTNVLEKLRHDLEFIYYLSSQISRELSKLTKIEKVQIRLNLNSAHILSAINP